MVRYPEEALVPTSVVRLLSTPNCHFDLTGSRYMGCAKPESDWDFITQDTPEARAFLKTAGFGGDILAKGYARGALTNAVVECITPSGEKVQVQLSPDAPTQANVRDIIKEYLAEIHRTADRNARTWIWDTLGAVLQYQPSVVHGVIGPC